MSNIQFIESKGDKTQFTLADVVSWGFSYDIGMTKTINNITAILKKTLKCAHKCIYHT